MINVERICKDRPWLIAGLNRVRVETWVVLEFVNPVKCAQQLVGTVFVMTAMVGQQLRDIEGVNKHTAKLPAIVHE